MTCNSHKCHCPSCVAHKLAERRRAGCRLPMVPNCDCRLCINEALARVEAECEASRVVGENDDRERTRFERELDRRDQYNFMCRQQRNRIRKAMVDGKVITWRWRCLPGKLGWVKVNAITGQPFGMRHERIEFTPTGFRLWGRPRPHVHTIVDPPDTWIDELINRKEVPVLSPLKLSILLWRAAHHVSKPYPSWTGHDGRSSALRELAEQQFIEFVGDGSGNYTLTERAKVYIKAIALLPMPVREEAPWKMPEPAALF